MVALAKVLPSQDTGLGVRKRVIKLLKQYYGVIEDLNRRIDICTKLVLRMLDEDDTVKDLAVKTAEELWFPNPLGQTAPNSKTRLSSQSQDKDKAPLLNKVSVIMGVSAFFKDRQSPLEDLLHKIISNQSANDLPLLRARYSEICEALIDGLVDASDLPGFVSNGVSPALAIFIFSHRLCNLASGHYTCSPQRILRSCLVVTQRRFFHTSKTPLRFVILFRTLP